MFSVIIPAYNSENTIEKALDSLRNQTKPELIREVIVINDGSADATADKVEQYKKRESCNLNIILYNQQNAGVAENPQGRADYRDRNRCKKCGNPYGNSRLSGIFGFG